MNTMIFFYKKLLKIIKIERKYRKKTLEREK